MIDTNKLELTAMFNVGEVVTGIQVGHLDEAKPESLLYCTIDGRIGIMYPFHGEENTEFTHLSMLQSELQ